MEVKQQWIRILGAWGTASARLQLHEPVAVSRCSFIPLFTLFVQSLIICILEACHVPLGIAGGVVQLLITCFFLFWMVLQLENADASMQTHGMLTSIHHEDEEDMINQL